MATINTKDKQLEKLVYRHFKDKLAGDWNKYQALCKRESVPIKQLLKDSSFYGEVKTIKIQHVENLLKKELNELKEKVANKEKLDPEQRAAKRRKLEEESSKARGVKCDKCNSCRVLYIYAHSNDSNSLTFPTGFDYQGYLPKGFRGIIGCGDAISMDLCVDCGHVVGFNRQTISDVLERIENRPDGEEDDE